MPNDPEDTVNLDALLEERLLRLSQTLQRRGIPIPDSDASESLWDYERRLHRLLEPIPKQAPTSSSPFRERLRKIAKNAVAEGVNTFFFIGLLAGGRFLVEHLFNPGSMFFDRFPVHWLFDVGDIAIIGRFIWNTLKGEE